MASIQKRPTGQWRARWRDPEGKEPARHFHRKADAQRWLDQVTADLVRGTYLDPKPGGTSRPPPRQVQANPDERVRGLASEVLRGGGR